MNNEPSHKAEPVAWIPKDHLKEMGKVGFRYTAVSFQEDEFYNIPLYTAEQLYPAKTLTDEEIEDALYVAGITLNNLSDGDIPMERIRDFSRAILKEANEK